VEHKVAYKLYTKNWKTLACSLEVCLVIFSSVKRETFASVKKLTCMPALNFWWVFESCVSKLWESSCDEQTIYVPMSCIMYFVILSVVDRIQHHILLITAPLNKIEHILFSEIHSLKYFVCVCSYYTLIVFVCFLLVCFITWCSNKHICDNNKIVWNALKNSIQSIF